MSIKNQTANSKMSQARRARQRVEMTTRIKDIARAMFVRDGYEAVTLQRIAAEIEYTVPAIYRYFKDKKDLLTAIVLDDMADNHAGLLKCQGIEDPLERLLEMARRNTVWAVSHPNHYLLFCSRAWTQYEDVVRQGLAIPQEQEPLFMVYTAVEELIKCGALKEEYKDPSLVTRTLWAAMHGVIMLEITMSGYDKSLIRDKKKPVRHHLETMITGLMKGILRDSKKEPRKAVGVNT